MQRLKTHAVDALEQQRVFWARDRLLAADPPRIGDVVAQFGISHRAYSCGYFDQAHFANDFRAFSGFRPSEFLRKATGEHANFIPID